MQISQVFSATFGWRFSRSNFFLESAKILDVSLVVLYHTAEKDYIDQVEKGQSSDSVLQKCVVISVQIKPQSYFCCKQNFEVKQQVHAVRFCSEVLAVAVCLVDMIESC